MTRRFNLFSALVVALFFSTALLAQPNVSSTTSVDELTSLMKDPQPKGVFPPKPKDMWEVGIHGGILSLAGDTPLKPPFGGFGFGLSVRKSLSYSWSLRGDFVYGTTYGQDFTEAKGLVETVPVLTALGYSQTSPFVFNFKTRYTSFGVQALYNLTNIKFHKSESKLGIYAVAGIGVFTYSTQFDATNGTTRYDYVTALANVDFTQPDLDLAREIRDIATNLQDGTYETEAPRLKIGRNTEINYNPNFQVGMGIAYRVSDRIALAIEPQVHVTANDYLDGRAYRALNEPSAGTDAVLYVPLRVNFFLGDKKKQILPLWWVNPLDKPYQAIAANTLKADPSEMMADKDNDGIPDLLDKEQDTPAGAEVDTRGVTLDSDKDGIANHLDQEPYSPVGYKIDPNTGISEKPKMPKTMTKDEIVAIGKEQGWDKKPASTTDGGGGIKDWFLPMIHFDNDQSSIKSQSYSALDQVAKVMEKYPSISVVVEGHASSEASDSYNTRLSYKRAKAAVDYLVSNYGISRSRLILRYGGESDPLVKASPANYMNRRVEFRVANGETEMGAPQ